MAKDEWVRVESEDELRAGMTVEVRLCGFCRCKERFIIIGRAADGWVRDADGNRTFGRRFRAAGGCKPEGFANTGTPAFSCSIREGRLWRLADLDAIDDTEVRSKELADV